SVKRLLAMHKHWSKNILAVYLTVYTIEAQ
ncbi:MAG: hypothetical protein ACI94Z_002422, partial [Yoonia sp.]